MKLTILLPTGGKSWTIEPADEVELDEELCKVPKGQAVVLLDEDGNEISPHAAAYRLIIAKLHRYSTAKH